ncbi:hypothetical protein COLO4_05565 [Corchorus olitorius]|uniref:Protein kinase domain-containing protein n=1 Tax=Corchorus olitorius TaxID=93759 RepID=A0A1R3KQH8_9ROSI|nr:hypothetical protein COLO4_05565 [Corchorus olitorius]
MSHPPPPSQPLRLRFRRLHMSSLFLLLMFLSPAFALDFLFNNFTTTVNGTNLFLIEDARIDTSTVRLTNDSNQFSFGRLFYPTTVSMKPTSNSSSLSSFSTSFVFSILPQLSNSPGFGLCFVLSNTTSPPATLAGQYFGQNVRAWIDFDGANFEINVTVAPAGLSKPSRPTLNYKNPAIANYVSSDMFVGFSASKTQWVEAQRILAWSFSDTGTLREINTTANLPNNTEVAVKCVNHDSKQGLREFMAEIESMGRLQHKNLVQMRGWCRKGNELMLVYDYMPNGSLNRWIFDKPQKILGWRQRLLVLADVAEATVAVPTAASDVYSFGVVVLEVVCGRRPLEMATEKEEEQVLIDWVRDLYAEGRLRQAADARISGEYEGEEVEMALKLGLACCHPDPSRRPTMKEVVAVLIGEEVAAAPAELLNELARDGSSRGGAYDGAGAT